jgi:hypothetical protein
MNSLHELLVSINFEQQQVLVANDGVSCFAVDRASLVAYSRIAATMLEGHDADSELQREPYPLTDPSCDPSTVALFVEWLHMHPPTVAPPSAVPCPIPPLAPLESFLTELDAEYVKRHFSFGPDNGGKQDAVFKVAALSVYLHVPLLTDLVAAVTAWNLLAARSGPSPCETVRRWFGLEGPITGQDLSAIYDTFGWCRDIPYQPHS